MTNKSLRQYRNDGRMVNTSGFMSLSKCRLAFLRFLQTLFETSMYG